MGDEDQLSLLGGVEEREPAAPAAAGARWAKVDAPGRLGFAPAGAPLEGLGASVVIAAVSDPAPLRERAAEADVDLRHLPLADGGPEAAHLPRQLEALAADLRQGRRAVVVGEPALAAFVCACALVEHGLDAAAARAALGGASAIGPAWMERLDGYARARGRAREGGDGPLIARAGASAGTGAGAGAGAGASASANAGAGAGSSAGDEDVGPGSSAGVEAEVGAGADADARDTDAEPGEGAGAEADARDGGEGAGAGTGASGLDWGAIARDPRRSRVVGAILGAAIGDAMGHPTEFLESFEAIAERYPPGGVRGFVLWIEQDGRRVAPYTDDTQMAEQVLRSLLHARDRGLELDAAMQDLAGRFVRWAEEPLGGHRAPGNACLAGCRNLAAGAPWHEAGGERAGGCGSVMRAYPFGLVFAHDLSRAERWAVAHSKLTHRDPIALAACAAMAVGVARVLRDDPLRVVLSEMVAAACRYSPKTAQMMARAMDEALGGVPPETTLDRLRGWAAHEAIAAAVYLFARHPDSPREAILEAANSPGDSDSLATLAGALVGARAGLAALPPDWVRDVERAEQLAALALR